MKGGKDSESVGRWNKVRRREYEGARESEERRKWRGNWGRKVVQVIEEFVMGYHVEGFR